MNEKWLAFAQQIAGLKAQVAQLAAERDELKHQLAQRTAAYDALLSQAELLKAVCNLHDAQVRAGIVVLAPPDDVITINLKELTK